MVYLTADGRQFLNKEDIEEGMDFIEIPDFIEPREEDGYMIYVVGIENGNPKYMKEPIKIPEPELSIDEKIYKAVSKSQDEIRQEGADSVMEELVKRGLIV